MVGTWGFDTKPKVVSAVTLELTPDQVEKLDLARSIGQLSLVLRNQFDMDGATTPGARREHLLVAAGKARPPAPTGKGQSGHRAAAKPVQPQPAKVAKTEVEIIRGIYKSTAQFPVE